MKLRSWTRPLLPGGLVAIGFLVGACASAPQTHHAIDLASFAAHDTLCDAEAKANNDYDGGVACLDKYKALYEPFWALADSGTTSMPAAPTAASDGGVK